MLNEILTTIELDAHPLRKHRAEVASGWQDVVHEISPSYRRMAQGLLRTRIYEALDSIVLMAVNGDDTELERFLAGLDTIIDQEHLLLEEVIAGLLGGFEAFDRVIPADERYNPAMIEAERALRRLVATFSSSAITIVTDKLAEEAAAQRESKSRLYALQRVGAAVTSSLDLESTLEMIVNEAAELMNGATARLRLADDEGQQLKLIASAGDLGDDVPGSTVPVETTLAGLCFRSGRPVISNDVASDPRANHEVQQLTRTRSLLSVPLMSRGSAIGVLSISNVSMHPFDDADAEMLSLFADHAAVAIENARLYQQAQSQLTELEIINRVSSVVSSTLDLSSIYRAIHQEIARIMVADAFLIFLRNELDSFDLVYIVDLGTTYAPRHEVRLPDVYHRSLSERRPFILDVRRMPEYDSWGRYGDMTRRVNTLVVAPLLRGNETIGAISAQAYTTNAYRQRDADLLATVANVAAVAIENARLYEQAYGLAVAEERNRLAREIHDTIAQGLVGIILQLEAASSMIGDEPRVRRRLDRAIELARVNLDEARRSVRDLRAAPLEHLSFAEAIADLAEQHRQECDGDVFVSMPESMPLLDKNIETSLFRFVQEALTNCRKHAREATVWIDIQVDVVARAVVRDNGPGFDVTSWLNRAPTHHFGLHGMRERAERLGGTLRIESSPTSGTMLSMELPLDC